MGDLFDALAARAMGAAHSLAPPLTPRFAPATEEPELDNGGRPDAGAETPSSTSRPARSMPEPETSDTPTVVGMREVVAAAATPLVDQESRSGDTSDAPTGVPVTRRRPGPLLPLSARTGAPDRLSPPQPASTTREEQQARSSQGVRAVPVGEPHDPPPRDAVDEDAAAPAARSALQTTAASDHVAPAIADQPAPKTPPHVTVSIGYVEVRSPTGPAGPSPRAQSRLPQPRISLQEYLRREGRR
jgi:hypothetical protein